MTELAPSIAEQLRAEAAPNRNIGLLDPALLTAAADELDRARPIVDAVLARYHHRANYPLAADSLSIDAYETATERWRIDDHNLDRAITRAAEAHLNTTEVHR